MYYIYRAAGTREYARTGLFFLSHPLALRYAPLSFLVSNIYTRQYSGGVSLGGPLHAAVRAQWDRFTGFNYIHTISLGRRVKFERRARRSESGFKNFFFFFFSHAGDRSLVELLSSGARFFFGFSSCVGLRLLEFVLWRGRSR